jgi:hypothetical protein
MLTAREAAQIMQESWRAFSGETVPDDDPEWQTVKIDYARRAASSRWSAEKDVLLDGLTNLIISEMKRYPRAARPSQRRILMCVFKMLQ